MILAIAAAAHLKVFTLLLAFVLNGKLEVERKSFPTIDECKATGLSRIEELKDDPRFDGIVVAACVPEEGQKS